MARAKLRYIVSRDQPELYEALKREFSGDPAVDVILERRQRGSNAEDTSPLAHHGPSDRRNDETDTTIRGVGWMIVRNQRSSAREG